MQHLRQLKISDELSAAGKQALVFAPRNGTADEGQVANVVPSQDLTSCTMFGPAAHTDMDPILTAAKDPA
jgi:hypothetical protein